MKIGYPCINRTLTCKGTRTFRLRSYSEERLVETVDNNLSCLAQILRFNLEHGLLFFRISSDLVPFASHPVCTFDWPSHFAARFAQLGRFIRQHDMRISMHPDQFTLLNALDDKIVANSVCELLYHAQVLDLLGMDTSAKIQIHIGGVYGDRAGSMDRFARRCQELDPAIRRRLVIENDDRSYPLQDCLRLHARTGTPVLFDSFHHQLNNRGETLAQAFAAFTATWAKADGLPMVDYSSQKPGGRRGEHVTAIDLDDWAAFVRTAQGYDFDVMLEIKNKERSAIQALEVVSQVRAEVMP